MKNKIIKPLLFLGLASVLFALAIFTERADLQSLDAKSDVARFQRVFTSKVEHIKTLEPQLIKRLSNNQNPDGVMSWVARQNWYKSHGIVTAVYRNDSLLLWSDNILSIPSAYSKKIFESPLVKIKNVWVAPVVSRYDEFTIVSLVVIKIIYFHDNHLVNSGFNPGFNIFKNWTLSLKPPAENNYFPIYGQNGDVLFYLIKPEKFPKNLSISYLSLALYIASLLFFALFLYYFFRRNFSSGKYQPYFIATGLFVFRFVTLYFKIPGPVYSLSLFQPYVYASSVFNPSLGDLLVNVMLLLFSVVLFHRNFRFPESSLQQKSGFFVGLVWIPVLFLVFMLAHFMVHSVIYDSTITFETYKILEIDVFSILGYAVLLSILCIFYLVADKMIQWLRLQMRYGWLMAGVLFFSATMGFLFNMVSDINLIYPTVSFVVIMALIAFVRYFKKPAYSWLVLMVLVFTLYSLVAVQNISSQKERSTRKIKAISLASEHDPIAELLLTGMDQKMKRDTAIMRLMQSEQPNYNDLYNYLRNSYFSGYWNRYDLQVTFCSQNDSVYLAAPDNRWEYCYGFFRDIIRSMGIKLKDCNFYYLNHSGGRISYLRELRYHSAVGGYGMRLYIELDSKLTTEVLGYPELLLDSKTLSLAQKPEYDYAKYKNGRLVAKSGAFPYSLNRDFYGPLQEEFSWFHKEAYSHLAYNIDQNTSILLSKRDVHWFDLLISFSYIFVFYFLVTSLIFLLLSRKTHIFKPGLNIKNKIQYSMISLLILTLIFLGGSNVWFNMQQNQFLQHQLINEKLQSIIVELDHKIGYENNLDNISKDYLNALLIKLSNVFFSDINFYDTKGVLYATSRFEIFQKGLLGPRMDPGAFSEMQVRRKASFIHTETIGQMSFYSSYLPFVNQNNQVLGYVNLPYFSKQADLKKQVSGFVAAIINIYALLIVLTILMALLIANKLTLPLRLIQQNLEKIKLDGKNQSINYRSSDEIGRLIEVYNRMVDELSLSAQQLMKSERESAWREMARQVAHEIKNPLTPMKLSVQILEKSWENKDNDFDQRIKRVTQTLIEQIDALTVIASEFGDFAKMKKTELSPVDIMHPVQSSLDLFTEMRGPAKVEMVMNAVQPVFVLADQEQLLRAFNNLFKNAIQAIPDLKKGIIEVIIDRDENWVRISISDNGTGLPPEMKDKLFKPNFTTKTSGMGLGLAIVKNIADDMGGTVTYHPRETGGSTFTLVLPFYNQAQ